MEIAARYADIFIPLAVSAIGALISFYVYKSKVDRLETDVKEVKIEIREIRDKVISCETSLRERAPLKKAKSPVSLTERGDKVLGESGGRFFVETNYEELKKSVEDQNPNNPYDIQEVSHKVSMELKTDPRINTIKDYAFKEGLELDDILDIMGIYLRDKILKDRNISVEAIDGHTPKA